MSKGIGNRQTAILAAVKYSGGIYANSLLAAATTAQKQATYRAIRGLINRGLIEATDYMCKSMRQNGGYLWLYDPARPDMQLALDRRSR